MSRLLTVCAAAGALALVSVARPTAADARCWGCGIAAGVIGGLAVGAIIAGAARPYDYGPGYAYGPAYDYDPGYAYGPGPYPGYGYYGGPYRYGDSTADITNQDRMMQGTR